MKISFPKAILTAIAVLGPAACAADPVAGLAEDFNIVFTGQSLIEHDPRAYIDAPSQSVRRYLQAADIAFTNLEVAVSNAGCDCQRTRDDIYFHGVGPETVPYLADMGFTLMSLSNNHAWDFGANGILSTIEVVESQGIGHAGTGVDLDAAAAPGFLNANGRKVALVAVATTNLPADAAATPERPGVNVLNPDDQIAWDRTMKAIRTADAAADIVIVYQHFQVSDHDEFQVAFARAAVDAGADVYVSHGEPTLAGVEQRGDGVIFYDLGNFLFHSKAKLGRYTHDVWESVLADVTFDADGVQGVTFTPVILNEVGVEPHPLPTRGQPEIATGELGVGILKRLQAMSGDAADIVIEGETARLVLNRQ